MPEYSPFDRPQRVIFGGLYRGIATTEPVELGVNVVPGQGEILILPAFSFEPGLTGIGIESIHGGALDVLRQLRYEDDPRCHDATVLDLLRKHVPHVYDRIDRRAFGLARPLDHFMTAITPTVRRFYTRLPNGRLITALGDAHVLMDPIIGQGANAIELLTAATQHKPIADFYASGFNHPQRMWELSTSPERTSALLGEFGWQGLPAPATALAT